MVEIEDGGVYTNKSECFAREVLEIKVGEITYCDFLISTGEPMSTSRRCSRSTFRQFAVRRSTTEETSRFQRDLPAREDESRFNLIDKLTEQARESLGDDSQE